MTSAERCPTVLIEDAPAGEDTFRGDLERGPHERVADAITEVVLEEPGGNIIGLEGDWGAGKSTIVNLVRTGFETSEHRTVFTFDTWAHEGDPLRRTYIETLVQHLKLLRWIDAASWDEKLDEIASRRKVTKTKTTPSPTWFGLGIGLSLLIVPAGTAFLESALEKGFTLVPDAQRPISWPLVFGLLSFSPILVALLNVILLTLGRGNASEPIFSIGRAFETRSWAFLSNTAESLTETESIETPNPTSLEFEHHFSTLMKEALGRDPRRRLLLVIDNLDRVSAADAIAVWSTLQTFIRQRHNVADPWYAQLWVLLPYDRSGLDRLWSASDETKVSKRETSASFLEKTLQVSFATPPLVLTNWQQYLTSLLKHALPRHDADFHSIYRVFASCRGSEAPPTPRQITSFVNSIGVIHRQWQHVFPLAHVAYFVLQQRMSGDLVEQLRSGALPRPQDYELLGKSLVSSLSGLAFNVPSALGEQLLLTTPIMAALKSGDTESLVRLADTHEAGFWAVLERQVSTDFFQPGFTAAVRCLVDSGALATAPAAERQSIISVLAASLDTPEKWWPLTSESAAALGAIAVAADRPEVAEGVVQVLSSCFARPDLTAKEQAIADRLRFALSLIRSIEATDHAGALATLRLRLSVSEFIDSSERIAVSWSRTYWKHLEIDGGPVGASGALLRHTSSGLLPMRLLLDSYDSGTWDDFSDMLVAELEGTRWSNSPLIFAHPALFSRHLDAWEESRWVWGSGSERRRGRSGYRRRRWGAVRETSSTII